MEFQDVIEKVGMFVEGVGVAIIVGGVLLSLGRGAQHVLEGVARAEVYERVRRQVGRSILLGLEVLVAGDIIRTVATDPSFTSVGVLALIVGIRTFLSFTLELEVTGRWPWQARADGRTSDPATP
jgi:uncharacterized membrane protein